VWLQELNMHNTLNQDQFRLHHSVFYSQIKSKVLPSP